MAAVSPFPWAKLPRLTRREVDATRRARATLVGTPALGEIASALTKLTGAPVELSIAQIGLAPHVAPNTVDVWLTPDGDRSRGYFAIEPGLVAALCSSLLGRSPSPHRPDHPPTAELVGAGSGLLVALLRRVTHHPWRLSASRALPDALWLELSVLVGEQPYAVSVAVPLPAFATTASSFDRRDLARLGDVPITLALVAAVSTVSRDELSLLELGAAFVPENGWSLRRDPEGQWSGSAWLAAGPAEAGIPVRVEQGPSGLSIVLSTGPSALPWDLLAQLPASAPDTNDPGATPVDPNDNVTVSIESAPVVIRVELGTVTMTAGEWARLAVGDVIGTGVRVGEPVTLRAGGAVYGHGELCEVEGELAVRLLSRGEHPR